MSSRQVRSSYAVNSRSAAGYSRSGRYAGNYSSAGNYRSAGNGRTGSGYYGRGNYAGQRSTARSRGVHYSPEYYYGTEAPDLYAEPYPQPQQRRRRAQEEDVYARNAALRNRQKAQHMNPALILFMLGVVAVMCVCLIGYLSLQAQVTSASAEVASLESSYQDLKQSNDEALNEINSSINLDEIKYKAITDLGMTYPDENQVINYSNDDSDYVHQVTQLDK